MYAVSKRRIWQGRYMPAGSQIAQLRRRRRRRRRRRGYAPANNTARHDNDEKIYSWISFYPLHENGALLKEFLGYWVISFNQLIVDLYIVFTHH